MLTARLAALALAAALAVPSHAASAADPWQAKARALLEQAVNIPTVKGRNRVPELAQLLAE